MDEATFWRLVGESNQARDGDCGLQVDILADKLVVLSTAEIIAVDNIIEKLMRVSYTRELWAAAYIINGGCSDDGFDYFRGWLITQGETIFYNALRDPESLAAVVDSQSGETYECENILSVADSAYIRKNGRELPHKPGLEWVLTGTEWDGNHPEALHPKLGALFSFEEDEE